MKAENWIFSVRYWDAGRGWDTGRIEMDRFAVVGPARSSTVEAALHLAKVPEAERAKIRAHAAVRDFVEGRLDPSKSGYYVESRFEEKSSWCICIGSVQEVLAP